MITPLKKELVNIIQKEMMLTGLNTACDYDGFENEFDLDNDIILYLNAVLNFYKTESTKNKGEKMNNDFKMDFGSFESIIQLIPKLEKFAQTVKTKPDVILNELIDLGYRVMERSKDEAIKEASERLKIYMQKKDFKFSDDSINTLQSLIDFLKKHNEVKNDIYI